MSNVNLPELPTSRVRSKDTQSNMWTFYAIIIGSGLDLKGITNAMIYDYFLLFRGRLNTNVG